MESGIIWISTILIILAVVSPYYFKFRKKLILDKERRDEAVRLGADNAVAQHPQIDMFTCIGCGACVSACPEGDVLGIVSGKATIINGLKCVGHGKCADACPVEGIQIGLGDQSKRQDIPQLTPHNETNIPGLFIAGELGGLALIKNAISQGRNIVKYISGSHVKSSSKDIFDVIIIGAGPAGLSAALTAVENGLSFIVLDQQEAGGTIQQYPRKKLVMTNPVELSLFGWLNKPEYSKEELLDIWDMLITKYKLNVHTSEKLASVEAGDDFFTVKSQSNTFSGLKVILALGRRGTPRKLNISGENQSKVMYKLIEAESYRNEHLLVVGGGDSAIEAAMGLARQPGNNVTLSYRKEKFFRIKKRNETRISELIHDNKINVIFNSGVTKIGKESVFIKTDQGESELKNDFVFIFAGGEPPFKLLKSMGIHFGG